MRCGSIAVKGEDAAPPRFKPRQRHGKRSTKNNPYSAIGLDKFARVYAELSAKRETIAAQTGAPPSLVRFVYAHRGWVPLVVRAADDPKKLFGPDHNKQQKKKNQKKKKNHSSEPAAATISISSSSSSRLAPAQEVSRGPGAEGFPWAQVLRTTAFGFMAVSAVYVWKSAVPAGAVALVMVVAELRRRWQGGALAMKKLLEGGLSYLRRKQPQPQPQPPPPPPPAPIRTRENIPGNPKARPAPGLAASAPVSPTWRAPSPAKGIPPPSKPPSEKKLRKAVSLENPPDRRRGGPAAGVRVRGLYDASVGATAVMIALGCLVLSGRLCATVCISVWWYLLPRLRPPRSEQRRSRLNSRSAGTLSSNGRDVDLRSVEYKKRVIMGGLVDRSHLRH